MSLARQQRNSKFDGTVGRNEGFFALLAKGEFRRDGDESEPADFHAFHAYTDASHDGTRAGDGAIGEAERTGSKALAFTATLDLEVLVEEGVVDGDRVAVARGIAFADGDVAVGDAGWKLDYRSGFGKETLLVKGLGFSWED